MRHPLHSICPYFAMFPEDYVARHLFSFTRPGDLILDPFCGRGTTILESTLQKRRALGTDVNLVAACVSGAKANVPPVDEVLARLTDLAEMAPCEEFEEPQSEFFKYCFHEETLKELLFLRRILDWRHNRVDRFIAAVALGVLHGEAHRSPNYFSNRMPRTISTKPDYSVRWWKERNLFPERREVFPLLRVLCRYRLLVPVPAVPARVELEDARNSGKVFAEFRSQVTLVVTSPPYLDTTDYAEDQWLRIWFLGGPAKPSRGASKDDRHKKVKDYWLFLKEVWKGCDSLLADGATIAIRIGGKKLSVEEITEGLTTSLQSGISRPVKLLDEPLTSEIKKGQLSSFRPGNFGKKHEHDYVFRLQ